MSTSASITLMAKEPLEFMQLLQGFQNTGWNFNNYAQISYLRLGGDEGDWEDIAIENQNEVLEIMKKNRLLMSQMVYAFFGKKR